MRWIELPVDEMIARYETGENTYVLGRAYGVCHETIRGRLCMAGVKLRRGGGVAPLGNKYALGHKGPRKPGGPLFDKGCGYLITYDREHKQCFLHRGCWEAYHGPIPEGHDIHHADEDRQHNVIENLVCVTRGEHMRLHRNGKFPGKQTDRS